MVYSGEQANITEKMRNNIQAKLKKSKAKQIIDFQVNNENIVSNQYHRSKKQKLF